MSKKAVRLMEHYRGQYESGRLPAEVPRKDVDLILGEYFPGSYRYKVGSHIIIQDGRLAGLVDSPDGTLTLCLKKGRHIRRRYFEKLVRACSMMEERDEWSEKRSGLLHEASLRHRDSGARE